MSDSVNEPGKLIDTLPADQELYPRLMAGEPDAWDLLDNFYRPRLNAYFNRRDMRTDDDRLDAIQNTFEVFVETLISGKYNPVRGNLSQWIYGIANRVLLDHKKSYASEYSKQDELSDKQYAAAENSEEIPVDQERQKVQNALAQLPEKDRQIVLLRINADARTWADIAQELGISESTAKMRYSRALTKLEHLLS